MGLFQKIRSFLGLEKEDIVPSRGSFQMDRSINNNGLNSEPEMSTPNSADDILNKTTDFLQETGKEMKEQGSMVWEKLKEKVEDLDNSTKEVREQLKTKANVALDKAKVFVNEKVEEAKKMEAEDSKMDANKDGFADKPIDFGKNVSEQHDELFTKAEEWLQKHDKPTSHAVDHTDATISKDMPSSEHKTIQPLELPKD